MKRKHKERKLMRLVLGALLAGSLLYAPDVAMAGVTTVVTDDNIGGAMNIYGNHKTSLDSYNGTQPNDNTITLDTTHAINNIRGAHANAGVEASNNTVTILNGTIKYAAYMLEASSNYTDQLTYSNNKIFVKGGSFTCEDTTFANIGLWINGDSNANTTVSDSHIVITGGNIGNNYSIAFQNNNASNNQVIKDCSISILTPLNVRSIYFNAKNVSNNTLNIGEKVTLSNMVKGVQNYNFYIPASINANDQMLVINGTNATDISGSTIGAAVLKGSSLAKGDKVDLIYNSKGVNGDFTTTELTTDKTATGLTVDTSYKLDVKRQDTNTIIAEITDVQEEVNPERTADVKSLVETRAATATYINAGSDLLADQGFASAAEAVEMDKKKLGKEDMLGKTPVSLFTPFSTVGGSSLRAESGSYVETKGFGMNLGFVREVSNSQGKLLFGPVVEYGGGSYDSYLDDGTHGEGGAHYFGVGLMARQINNDGFYYEGSLRGGRVNSDYKSVLDGIGNVNYDSSSNYWAAHLGFGKIFDIGHNNTVDGYCKYFFSHQGGDTATIHLEGLDDEKGVFDAVNSHRLRIGARLTHKINETNRIYGGLAYQYEFGGEARAHFNGNSVPSPSIKGSSGMLELGWKFKPDNGPMTLDLGLNGWVGKQRGGSVHLGATWTF